MSLSALPYPSDTPCTSSSAEPHVEATARPEDTVPRAFVGVPLDVDELEDTLPSILAPDFDPELFEAPTQPDLSMNLNVAMDDRQWERVLRAVGEAVRRVFAHQTP